jgi:hypothetical protein
VVREGGNVSESDIIVFRFRDLVTEPGGTIEEHRRILSVHGSVWWGWWMRQYESAPTDVFAAFASALENGSEPEVYLFDSGQALLFAARLIDVRVALPGDTIGPPDLATTPDYYQRGSYPAWLRLASIEDTALEDQRWAFVRFPTHPNDEHGDVSGRAIESLEELRQTDATMWAVRKR